MLVLKDVYYLVFFYLAISSGIIIFSSYRDQLAWKFYLGMNIVIASIGVLFLIGKFKSIFFLILMQWVPLFLILYFYQVAGVLSRAFYNRTFDDNIISIENRLCRGKPPFIWLSEVLDNYWFSEFLHGCYFFFIPLLYSFPLYFYLKQDLHNFYLCSFSILLLLFINFLIHCLIPVISPRTIFEKIKKPLSDGFVYRCTHWVVELGSATGTGFPSTHVAIGTLCLLIAYHVSMLFFFLLLPFCFGLILSTVYGRFHYVIDVLAGMFFAFISFHIVYQN